MAQKTTFGELKNCIKETLESFLYHRTHRNPIVIPVILNQSGQSFLVVAVYFPRVAEVVSALVCNGIHCKNSPRFNVHHDTVSADSAAPLVHLLNILTEDILEIFVNCKLQTYSVRCLIDSLGVIIQIAAVGGFSAVLAGEQGITVSFNACHSVAVRVNGADRG